MDNVIIPIPDLIMDYHDSSQQIGFYWGCQDQAIIESTGLNLLGLGSIDYVHCPRFKCFLMARILISFRLIDVNF